MRITREYAMRLWFQNYGFAAYAEDFDGGLMYREAYGERDFFIWKNGKKIYCGWNIHHILPLSRGGTDAENNLICTNIITNDAAGDRITYWIDEALYQVKRIRGIGGYKIVRLV